MKPHEECDLPIGHQGECRELLDLTPVGPGRTIADVKRKPYEHASRDAAEDVRELIADLGGMPPCVECKGRESCKDVCYAARRAIDMLTRLSASEAAIHAERDHLAAMVRAIGKRYPEVCDMARAEVIRDSAAKG